MIAHIKKGRIIWILLTILFSVLLVSGCGDSKKAQLPNRGYYRFNAASTKSPAFTIQDSRFTDLLNGTIDITLRNNVGPLKEVNLILERQDVWGQHIDNVVLTKKGKFAKGESIGFADNISALDFAVGGFRIWGVDYKFDRD
ncbi:MAG: hypothetical protein LKE33_08320 [Acidaminococcus sp.]|jgi:hypothetical protein|nr:hypothetical protein [Acidaminococcus sp.]MCI2099747.1 hypothetical protein [Acidaminococcus sp.]MCI2113983.1 hypothetical protein [Acidaminococcus sp.]MCI2116092.1 hypothetical protein [Acidaminococcus sp.]